STDCGSAAPQRPSTPERMECSNTPPADDNAWICHGIERDLGLPIGSLELWEPIRSHGRIQQTNEQAPNEQPQEKQSRRSRSRPTKDQLEFQFDEPVQLQPGTGDPRGRT